ncbi:MAG: phosphotransferase enzyme family protein [Chloroflexota bacterium]
MTYDEQVERLTWLARDAATSYGLKIDALDLSAYTNNAVFRLTSGKHDYALRVHRPGHKPLAWVESEAAWRTALFAAGLNVPEPLGGVYTGRLMDYTEPVHCTLSRWIEGAPRTLTDLHDTDLELIGVFARQLHTVSQSFDPPPGFDRPHLDWGGLFGAGGPYDPGAGMRYFDGPQRAVIARVTAQVRQVMNRLGRDRQHYGLIHADLIAKNLLFDAAGNLAVVDFDECAYGYYLYDLTPLIWLARGTTGQARVAAALWRGYNAVEPLDAAAREALDTFVMARHVASCRWVAGNADHPAIRGQAEKIIAERVDEMRHYLMDGVR